MCMRIRYTYLYIYIYVYMCVYVYISSPTIDMAEYVTCRPLILRMAVPQPKMVDI